MRQCIGFFPWTRLIIAWFLCKEEFILESNQLRKKLDKYVKKDESNKNLLTSGFFSACARRLARVFAISSIIDAIPVDVDVRPD